MVEGYAMKWPLLIPIAFYCFGSFTRPLFAAALLGQLAYLGWRGSELGRLPLIGPHDTLTFFSASIGVMGLPLVFSRSLRDEVTFRWITGMTAGLFALLALRFPAFDMPLPPILRTYWFEGHVVLAFFAYALFALGAILGALFLFGKGRILLDLQYRVVLVGYTFFSLSMISGGIWGYYAWGTYWLWTPKEFWTSILWLFYSFLLHLRLKGPTWDRVISWGALVGFAITLFTYLGVSMLMKSSHSF
jgi:ABC-type transport system involved in cytochrome c biogenesis permease subunit